MICIVLTLIIIVNTLLALDRLADRFLQWVRA